MTEQWHADIDVNDAIVKECIEAQMPQLLPIESLKCVGEGWDNQVYLLNNEIIFRFPRREVAVQLLQRENNVLLALQDRIDLTIPNPIYVGRASTCFEYPFQGYQKILGHSGGYVTLTDLERAKNIKPLAFFLKQLHSIKAEEAKVLGAGPQVFDRIDKEHLTRTLPERVAKLHDRKIISINKSLLTDEINAISGVSFSEGDFTLVHGDLYCKHLLFNDGCLSGVIDWGDMGINHPCVDLSVVYSFFPESAHSDFFGIYGEVEQQHLAYARFMALYGAIAQLLYSHDVGDMKFYDEVKASITRINPGLILEQYSE